MLCCLSVTWPFTARTCKLVGPLHGGSNNSRVIAGPNNIGAPIAAYIVDPERAATPYYSRPPGSYQVRPASETETAVTAMYKRASVTIFLVDYRFPLATNA